MNSKRTCWSLFYLYFSLLHHAVNAVDANDLAKSLIKHANKNIMLIANSENTFSHPIYVHIIKEVVNSAIPSTIINARDITHLGLPEDQRLQSLRNLPKLISPEDDLIVIFIDEGKDDVIQELMNDIIFLNNYLGNMPRPKCAFILENTISDTDLSHFLMFSWKFKFLYTIVVEFPPRPKSQVILSSAKNLTIEVHDYNPFSDTYTKSSFSAGDKLFSDKLDDFHGYYLKSALYEDLIYVMIENDAARNLWKRIHGADVVIFKTLAKFFNFAVNITSTEVDHSDEASIKMLDFVVNLSFYVGRQYLPMQYLMKPNSFLYPWSNNIIVKQYGTYKSKMSINLISLIATFTFVLLIIAFVWIFQFDVKVWTVHNIITILIGYARVVMPRKNSERILFLCLVIINLSFLTRILVQLSGFFFVQRTFLDLQTLKQLKKSNILPRVVDITKEMAFGYNNTAVEELMSQSPTIDSYGEIDECLKSLLNGDESVHGCEVLSLIGKFVAKNFVEAKNECIISYIDEPVLYGWATMMHSKTSPYMARFDKMLRRLYESGLVTFWENMYLRQYTVSHTDIFNFKEMDFYTRRINQLSENISSSQTGLVYALLIGQTISIIIFVFEMILGRIKLKFNQIRMFRCIQSQC